MVLLDFAHEWNKSWVEKEWLGLEDLRCLDALYPELCSGPHCCVVRARRRLAGPDNSYVRDVVVLFNLCPDGLLQHYGFQRHANPPDGCWQTVSACLCLVLLALALKLPRGSLLEVSLVGAYCAYLCLSSVWHPALTSYRLPPSIQLLSLIPVGMALP